MITIRQTLLLLWFVFTFSSCVTYTIPGGNADVSAMYNPGKTSLHPEFSVQIQSDTTANLLIRVLRDEILFSRANAENKLKGSISIHCRVYSDTENKQIYDSLTVYRDVVFTRNPVVVSVVKLHILPGKFHKVQVWVQDQKRLKAYRGFTTINNNPDFGGQRYYSTLYSLRNKKSVRETMNFYPWVPDSFGLKLYGVNMYKPIRFVAEYTTPLPLPEPPYIDTRDTLKLIPDTTYQLPSVPIVLKQPGFYFFRPDTNQQMGYGILKTPSHFPNIKTPASLIDPLEYLCSSEEFTALKNSPNKKIAVDEFWMRSAHDYTKAKQLIRVYYNRTKYANVYFSAMREGWRTDRGMIFVLLGPPDKLYRTAEGEHWEYGGTNQFRKLEFDFVKIENPYSDNYYMLKRKTDHRSIWRSAVASWRNGKIYNGEEPLHTKVYASSKEIE